MGKKKYKKKGPRPVQKTPATPLNKKPRDFAYLGFWIPFLAVGLTLMIRAISYTANSTAVFSLLQSDAYHQYFPFFKAFRAAILSGDGLLYTWSVGLGTDYLGLISYYLGSPLNFLSIFVPEQWLVGYFTFIQPVRIGLAGLFFSLMLQKIFNKNDLSVPLFASFYATCAWVFGYMWNSMWVDTFALLPLVVLGTYELLKNRKFVLYCVSLCLSVAINYYIGFFTCIFTLLVFICYEICYFKSIKRFLADLGLMGVFTVIAIGMSAFITLPAYTALQTTSSSVNEFPTTFKLNIADENTWKGLLDAMKQVATNTFAVTQPNTVASEGLPNIYCGVVAQVFALLFLTCKQIKWRERICGLVMLLFLNASFIIRQLDYIWHGFHFTNMIPYRFSFLYSFVMVFLAYKAWLLRRRIRPWQVVVTGAAALALFFTSNAYTEAAESLAANKASIDTLLSNWTASKQNWESLGEALSGHLFIIVNGLLLGAYVITLGVMSVRKPFKKLRKWSDKRQWHQKLTARRAVCSTVLMCVIAAELLVNVVYFGCNVSVTNLSAYPRGTTNSEKVLAVMEELEEDTLFYRAETTHTQTYNDGALNGYNGITTFSSSSNASVTNFMKALGYGAQGNWNRYAYEESSPICNMFLNLKYMIERSNTVQESPYYTDVYSSGKVHLLQNNIYLPLGFMTNEALAELSFDNVADKFDFQDQLLSAALGEQVDAWTPVNGANLRIQSTDNVTLNNVSETGSCSYSAGSSGGSVFYTYTFDQEGFFCVYYNMPKRNDITVSYDCGNDYTTLYTETYAIPFMMAVCQVNPGDRVQITLKCDANQSGTLNLTGSLLDESTVQYAYERLSQSTMELTSFETTKIEGTVSCQQDGLLYTSIPQNSGNWHVYVDGEEAEVTLIGGAMVGVRLTEGEHTVTFRYKNKSFLIGSLVSVLCLCLLVAIWWLVYRWPVKFPGKYEAFKAARIGKRSKAE